MGTACTRCAKSTETGEVEVNYQPLPTTFEDLLTLTNSKRKQSAIYLKNYWKILLLIASFYSVPSIQFVTALYNERSHPEVGVYCYYNYKCDKTILGIEAFNNVASNLGYLLLGLSFLFYIRVKDRYNPIEPLTIGLHGDRSLYYALGWSVTLEGVFSGLYHLCPSRVNFQFDTTFMTIGAALLFISLHQKRQPTAISGAFRAYGWLGALILLNVISLINISAPIFWMIVLIIMTYVSVTGSFYLYFYEPVRIDKSILERIGYHVTHPSWPRDKLRFFTLMFANVVNYALTITVSVQGFETVATQDFPNFILGIIILDLFLYLFYYILMKFRSKERVNWRVWILFVGSFIVWGFAIYFYSIAVTNKFLTPDQSAALNKPCVLFNFFDYHDIWHFLSAIGVVILFAIVYFLDMDLESTPCSQIRVF